MDIRRRNWVGTAGAMALLSAVGQAVAQPKPGVLRIVCGYAAGGTSDLLCRLVAGKLAPGYASTALVDNRTGAQAMISVAHVKQQPADGSVILQSAFTTFTLFPHLYNNLQYEPSDFVPLTAGCHVEYGFAVGPGVPAAIGSLQEYLAWARRDPKNATFAAIGQLPSISGLLLGKASNVELVPVQYKGGAPAVHDTMAGNIPGVVTTVGDISPFLGEKLRLLATTGDKRNPLTPGIATFMEQGVPDVIVRNYFGFFSHARTPPDLVASHSAAIRAAIAQKDVSESLARAGMIALPIDPQQTVELLKKDRAQWGAYVKRVNYQPVSN